MSMHPADYQRYLKTTHWTQRRAAYYSRHPKLCRACDKSYGIQLHHKTYVRLGHEKDRDLVPLCHEHHMMAHAYYDTRRFKSLEAATNSAIRSVRFKRRVKALFRVLWRSARKAVRA